MITVTCFELNQVAKEQDLSYPLTVFGKLWTNQEQALQGHVPKHYHSWTNHIQRSNPHACIRHASARRRD